MKNRCKIFNKKRTLMFKLLKFTLKLLEKNKHDARQDIIRIYFSDIRYTHL